MRSHRFSLAFAIVLVASSVYADEDATAQARAEFSKGAEHVNNAQWAEALARFERSSQLRSHAVTTYNIGACQRAMGRYTLARETFLRALAQNDQAGGSEIPQGVLTEMKGYMDQIDHLLVDVNVILDPPNASIAVDGRALVPSQTKKSGEPLYLAGVKPPGEPEPAPAPSFHVLIDPGAHVFTLTRKGFSDSVVNKTFTPGSTALLKLQLDKLPATMHITSEPTGAAASLEGVDIGITPLEVSRPAGSYVVGLKKSGFLAYSSTVNAQAGESVNVFGKLPVDKPSIAERWWFWAGIGALIAGGILVTYAIVASNQEPKRPPLDGGGLKWNVPVP